MAFFRNFSNDISGDVPGEKGRGNIVERVHGSIGKEDAEASSSEKDFEMKMDGQFQSDGEAHDARRMQNDACVSYDVGARANIEPSRSRTNLAGKWGSSFWKDCQPRCPPEGSDSEQEQKNVDDDKNQEALDYNLSEDSDGEVGQGQRGQTDVPADEMLSDDYYEQDGEDQRDSLHYKGLNKLSTLNSRAQARPVTVCKNMSRNSKSSKYEEYSDNDNGDNDDPEADADYEEEDEEDEDDPDDVDFDPDGGIQSGHTGNKDRRLDGEESEDDIESDDDMDLLDEGDAYYKKKPKGTQRGKAGGNVKASKEQKSLHSLSRKKRGKSSYEEEDSSARDSNDLSDDDFRSITRRGAHQRKNNGGRFTHSDNINNGNNEVRTSCRSVRKVSYVESDESEEIEEGKKKKLQKEDAEEEDGDSIEKVLWHQPKGMAEEALINKRSSEPVLLSHLFDTESDWYEIEFFIKWKGQSHLHCQWKSFSDLQGLSGFKKVLNYTKRVMEEIKYRKTISREEIEVNDVSKEMDLDIIKQNCQVERVIADRISKDGSGDVMPEYLVKWQGLSYAEVTWEKDVDIAFAQGAIDEYKAREAALSVQGKMVDIQRKKSKASLRKLDEQPEWLKGGKLRDYQLEGLNFLVNSWRNDTNVILADEMGLGKTVQSVSMLGFLQNAQQIYGPFLVVVPLSTLANWAKEFKKWLPEMNVIVYVGTRASREVCEQYEFYTNKRSTKFNALLTTYEVILKDKAALSKIKWNYLMVDEAHRLKNCEAQLYTTLLEFSTKNKVLITGTPLQNSVEELWALLHFLDSSKFRSKDEFIQNYKNLSSFNENELANLHTELRPHILRRVIKDVEKSLPPKIERILRVEMSPIQKQYYKWILERNFHDLNKGVRGNQVSLLNIVVELKKCCNHPFLFESADHGYGGGSNLFDNSKLDRIIFSSGKLVILDKLLIKLHEANHRVLIFSQMVRLLDILAEYLSLRGFQFQRLDGSTKAELRQQAMDHFNAPGSDDFCFLLSTRAGGLGINLATADTVIIFDSDWNPQNDLQAMSRAHRIGQQEVVNIYRFVTSKSVEEDILERAKKKMVLDHLVIQKLNAEGRLEKKEAKKGSLFDKNELSAILRFGAEELFKEERNDEENKKRLLSMDIDEILERAEKVEEKEAGGEEGNELLSAFKVANICSAGDDASFWSRWIKPEAVAEVEETVVPRAARKNKSYAEHDRPEKSNKRKSKQLEPSERVQKRRKADNMVPMMPMIEGTAAQVRGWSLGNLSKRDATRFYRAVMKFGIPSQINSISVEVGGIIESAPYEAQIELFNALIDGCNEAIEEKGVDPKGPLLDFFGVTVRANDLLTRVQELQHLAKRISRYEDPIGQFRVLSYLKPSTWSKGCGWNQIDDARLLLGIHHHGFGNWETIRLDERLGLTKKIAPVELQLGETFLPRAPNLRDRANALLELELAAVSGKNLNAKGGRRVSKKDKDNVTDIPNTRNKERKGRPGSVRVNSQMSKDRPQKLHTIEPLVKEEGEMSDTEEVYEQFKEVKWKEWCEDVMVSEMKTLKRLQRLQTTSADLPKEKVLAKIRSYLQLLGRRIDQIVAEHEHELYKQDRMTTRLWNYVSTFSNLSGERLNQIYSKLKQEQHDDAGVGPSLVNASGLESMHNGIDIAKFEAWKRRRRTENNSSSQVPPPYQRPTSNGARITDSSSLGILGAAPSENKLIGIGKPPRTRKTGFPPN